MWNDAETNIDLLGHSRITRAIVALIREQELSPLTIGVYGDWGAGKSSVLKLVEKELGGDDTVCCLTFNGWLFQGYEDTKSTMMEAIIGELRKQQPKNEELKRKAKEMLSRIDWLKLARRTAGLAFMGLSGIPDPLLLTDLLGKLKGVVSAPIESITAAQLKAVGTAVQSSIKDTDARTIPDEILAFRNDFEELIKTAKLKRLVVLIDDLDRCLPETTIDVLEAMRLLLYVPGTIFILGADERMIAYAVKKHFPDLPVGVGQADYPRNYLEKLIQIPFRLPPLGKAETRTYVTLLLAERALSADIETLVKCRESAARLLSRPWEGKRLDEKEIEKAGGVLTAELKKALLLADRISNPLAEGLQGNPRQIKRFLNTLVVRTHVAEAHGISDAVKLDELAKLMLVERFHEKFYEDLISRAAQSQDGKVKELSALEMLAREGGGKKTKKKGKQQIPPCPDDWKEDKWLLSWARIEPPLGDVDLRPYYFVSREKTPGFTTELGLGAELELLAERLGSGQALLITGLREKLGSLDSGPAGKLFEHLTENARSSIWKTKPPEFEGLYELCHQQPDLQEGLVKLFEDRPLEDLGAWAATGMKDVLTEAQAIAKFESLIRRWQEQDTNKALQMAAKHFGNA